MSRVYEKLLITIIPILLVVGVYLLIQPGNQVVNNVKSQTNNYGSTSTTPISEVQKTNNYNNLVSKENIKASVVKLTTKGKVMINGQEYPFVKIQFNIPFSYDGYTTFGDIEQGIVADNEGIYLYLKESNSKQWIVKYDHYGNLIWSYRINVWIRDVWMWQDTNYLYLFGLDQNNNKFYMKFSKSDGSIQEARTIKDGLYKCFTLLRDNQTYMAAPDIKIAKDLSSYSKYTYGKSEYIVPFTNNNKIFSIFIQSEYTNGGQDFLVRLFNKDIGKVERMYFFGTPIKPVKPDFYYQDDDIVPFWPYFYDNTYGYFPVIVKTRGSSIVGEFDLMWVSRNDGSIVKIMKYILPHLDVQGNELVPMFYKRFDPHQRNLYPDVWKGSYVTTSGDGLSYPLTNRMNFRIEKIVEHNDYFEMFIPYWYYDGSGIKDSAILVMKIDKNTGYIYNNNDTQTFFRGGNSFVIYPARRGMTINSYYVDQYGNLYVLYSITDGKTATMYMVQTTIDYATTFDINFNQLQYSETSIDPSKVTITSDQIIDVGG